MAGRLTDGWAAAPWANYAAMGKCTGSRRGRPHCVVLMVSATGNQVAMTCVHCTTMTTKPWTPEPADLDRAEQSQAAHASHCGGVEHLLRLAAKERIQALADKRKAAETFRAEGFVLDPRRANDLSDHLGPRVWLGD